MINGSDPSGMKISVTPPGELRPDEVLAKDRETTNSVVEEDSYKYHLVT